MTRVLIVDDEEMIRDELRECLELEDFEVKTAASAMQALDVFDTAQIDVVVTDLKMPQMGGLELLRHLRNKQVSSAVFVVSGHGAQSNAEEAMELGAVACFSKPLDVDALVEKINETLGG